MQKYEVFLAKDFLASISVLLTGFCFLSSIFYFPFSIKVAQAQDWQAIKSEHSIVYFINDPGFAKDVSRRTEVYYKRIGSELGYQRYSDFWTWDNRVKIYIYPDKAAYLKETGQPAWSEGLANYTDKTISSYAWSEGFLDMLLPHELTHLIFRDYVGFEGEVPLWLDEGVSQWMEPHKRKMVKDVMRRLMGSSNVLSLQQMMMLDVRESRNPDLVNIFYVQAVSLVDFLITKYGASRFTDFCRQLRDGKAIEDSLRFAYPRAIRTMDEFETKWKQYIMEEKK